MPTGFDSVATVSRGQEDPECPFCEGPVPPQSSRRGPKKVYCSDRCRSRDYDKHHPRLPFEDSGGDERDALARLPFDPHKLRRNEDPDTSDAAAHSVGEVRGRHFVVILQTLESHGPLTTEEISGRSSLGYHAVARRMRELLEAGRVRLTGERRKNRSGRQALVWEVPDDD